MTKVYKILVETSVDVTLKDESFTPQFMEEFRSNFYPFYERSEHAQHIAQLVARVVEGYGHVDEFVLSARIIDTEMEVVE